LTARLGIWFAPEGLAASASVEFAQRLESLGYESLWVGETFGRDPFVHIANLGHETERLTFATGIANIYHRHPGVMKQAANTLAEQLGGRFVLGLGVSSPQIVSGMRGIDYGKPLSYMREYLEAMENAFYASVPPAEPVPVVLAALGPKMLALAGERSSGAHTYNVTPEHTVFAREILGSEAQLVVEQKVVLERDAAKARDIAKQALKFYRKAPGYRNAWQRLGFSEDEIDSGAERYLDALVAWGDESTLRTRIDAHFAAGATQVLLQPLHPEHGVGVLDWKVIEALAPGTRGDR
jgi:probable F420-dependent oxidoreductase